jgi:hypothetical protein
MRARNGVDVILGRGLAGVVNHEQGQTVLVSDALETCHRRVVGLVAADVSVDGATHFREYVHDGETAVRELG